MSVKNTIIYISVLAFFIVGAALIFTSGQKPPENVVSYSVSDTDKPVAVTDSTLVDSGNIKLTDVLRQDFSFTNTGTKPLQVLNITTSCGCTSGQIIYKDEMSKEFSMHKQSGFVTEIEPGDTATVRLTYRPATMPVSGLVTRDVYVTTNDPANPKLSFGIKVRVD